MKISLCFAICQTVDFSGAKINFFHFERAKLHYFCTHEIEMFYSL